MTSQGAPTVLTDRAVLTLSGKDRVSFLQGLVTADTQRLQPGQASWAALLTPQGKILYDFIVLETGQAYLIDGAGAHLEALARRLGFYKLRADVALAAAPELAVVANPVDAAIQFADPRLAELGSRGFVPAATVALAGDAGAYHERRIRLGIPDSVGDIGTGQLFPHEANLDQLGGVSFTKGCYVGQEVVSRMEHRGTARSRILPVSADRPLARDAEIRGAGRQIGTVLSTAGNHALALIRLDRLEDARAEGVVVSAGDAALTVIKPAWARFPVAGAEAA